MEDSIKNHTRTSEDNPLVFLDIAVQSEKVGRVVIELFKDVVPRTAENFRALCTGEKGIGTYGKKLHYKGSIFHKVLPQFMIQGGDIINFNGTGGESIYGREFEDENFKLSHMSGGLLSMVNNGVPNSNSSQFVITISASMHLNNTNVVFGKVLKGMGVILEVSEVTTIKDIPTEKIHITDCGEIKPGEDWGLNENDGTEDIFPAWPEDWDYATDTKELDYMYIIEVIKKIKDSGNYYFSKKNYVDAGRKYKKALRYYKWMTSTTIISNSSDDLMVLQMDKNNSKALFRRSQAYMGLNEYDFGLRDLKQALLGSPNNKDILMEIEKVKKIMNTYLAIEKASCQRMFK
ncbi:cyclophilin 40 isoform X2 [Nomia melanderi]|uniref:cyclophilin 40 isoform X2 n=1 Tax=Nomia melanderi TaxID=2448451 RepID=UPI0013042D56|nr:peptidyl-prolyl cis-trans isomerase 1-like isoform X2 [Nomia melanderi]